MKIISILHVHTSMKVYYCSYEYFYLRQVKEKQLFIFTTLEKAKTHLEKIKLMDPMFHRGYIYEYVLDNINYKSPVFTLER
jgi:hypothetical protein